MKLHIRPANPDDRRMVADNWIRSWMGGQISRMAQVDAFAWAASIDRHIDACDKILVATINGQPVGWVARLEPDLLGYVYMYHLFRRQGFATKLLEAAGFDLKGRAWRYAFGTKRMRKLCSYSLTDERAPWKGSQADGKQVRRILTERAKDRARVPDSRRGLVRG
jgi:GNAT superfamily N-acetyltransferase